MNKISVLTIVHNRPAALLKLMNGLSQGQLRPAELVIIYMNEAAYPLPPTPFPVLTHCLYHPTDLPLAQARNQAVQLATQDYLIFLDVDCIPHSKLVQTYAKAFEQPNTLWAGPVRYLRPRAEQATDFWQQLDALSDPDPIRTYSTNLPYHLFWSLNFGCRRQTFDQIGQFDEHYVGYGAEDTDFAFSARRSATPLHWIDALAYHQHHISYNPPLNHLQTIVANAIYFRHKWQVWPMAGWLTQFQQRGLIHWTTDHIELIRQPTLTELAATRKE